MAMMRFRQAVAAALRDEMERDEAVVVFGEDVAEAEGPFKTSEGLLDRFGPNRVRDTPISEMGFLGAAVGAAAVGLRPVAEIMFVEFMGVALDMIVTEAAKFHYMSGGRYTVPLVVRASVGSGGGFGLQHSQTLENWVSATPGLTVAVPSDPQAAYGLLRSAIRHPGPVVILEPRSLYPIRSDVVTGEAGIVPLGIARKVRSGGDLTIVTLGQTVASTIAACETTHTDADVIDLATLYPWDEAAVLASVMKTNRLVVVEEAPLSGGWGSEIVAAVTAKAFGQLKSAPFRITAPNVPVPYGRELELRYCPSPEYIGDQLAEYLNTGVPPQHWWEREEVEYG